MVMTNFWAKSYCRYKPAKKIETYILYIRTVYEGYVIYKLISLIESRSRTSLFFIVDVNRKLDQEPDQPFRIVTKLFKCHLEHKKF